VRDRESLDLLVPRATDHGTIVNMKFSCAEAHIRVQPGGWSREVTPRELSISTGLAEVNMRLRTGGDRALYRTSPADGPSMLDGHARVTVVDQDGRQFVDDGAFSEDGTVLISDWHHEGCRSRHA
jgi:oxalate decarboxylase